MTGHRASPSRVANRRRDRQRWGVVVVEGPESIVEELASVVAGEGLGSESRPGTRSRSEIRLYFPSEERARTMVAVVTRRLAAAGCRPGAYELRVESIEDERWVEAYQASLRPFDLGAGFRVHPEGGESVQSNAGEKTPIRLVPGQAFGTGEHETTRLCVELLECLVMPGQRWLDLGCGTGILSVVACHRGAVEVRGYDHDPVAVQVAREVLEANGLKDRVRVSTGSATEARQGHWHGVVANIEGQFFAEHIAEVAALLRPGGSLVASGFLVTDVGEMEAHVRTAGLEAVEIRRDGCWAALVARRAHP